MATYVRPSLSHAGLGLTRDLFEALAKGAETFVFVYLGMAASSRRVAFAAARQGRPLTARGALTLAHGGPLGSRAGLRPLGPHSVAEEPLRGAAQHADATAFDVTWTLTLAGMAAVTFPIFHNTVWALSAATLVACLVSRGRSPVC